MATIIDINDLFLEFGRASFKKIRPQDNTDDFDFEVLLDEVQCTPEDNATFKDVGENKDAITQIVFTSVYDNKTKNEQQHSFTAKRSTVATATMKMTEGFTKGFDVGFSVKVPQEVTKATSGFGHQVVIKTETTNIVQKELFWSIDSPVKVSGKKRAIARLEVKEQEYTCKFEGWVVLKGKVKIRVSREGEFETTIQNKVGTIVGDHLPKHLKGVKHEKNTVRWQIKGDMTFNYGVSQNVEVSEVELPKDENKEKKKKDTKN